MIRVAHIVGNICDGGVASVVLELYRNIDRNKFQFDFYSFAPSVHDQEILSLGGRVFYIKAFSRPFSAMRFLKERLAAEKYTIVHAHLNTLNYFVLRAARKAAVPIRIAHNHSTSAPLELKSLVKLILKPQVFAQATDIAACSVLSAEWIYGRHADKAIIFNNGINIEKFAYSQSERLRVRKSLGLSDEFVIGHAGRFVYQKNHGFLIDTMTKILEKEPTAKLLLAGSGRLEEKIKRKARQRGIAASVIFLGERSDMAALYSAFDIFVLPSRYEGLPVVAIEAQAAGLPVIMSDRVSREAGITTYEYMSLDEDWSDGILSYRGFARKPSSERVRLAGYDMAQEVKKLEEYYEGLIRREGGI